MAIFICGQNVYGFAAYYKITAFSSALRSLASLEHPNTCWLSSCMNRMPEIWTMQAHDAAAFASSSSPVTCIQHAAAPEDVHDHEYKTVRLFTHAWASVVNKFCFTALLACRTSRGRSLRPCSPMWDPLPSLGSTYKPERENSTKVCIAVFPEGTCIINCCCTLLQRMIDEWLLRKSDTLKMSWTMSCLRSRGSGPHSSWLNYARIFVLSTESTCLSLSRVRSDLAVFSPHQTRKERWDALTVWDRQIKCGG